MSAGGDLGNPLRKFKLVFLGEQSGESHLREGFFLSSPNDAQTCAYIEGHACNPCWFWKFYLDVEDAPFCHNMWLWEIWLSEKEKKRMHINCTIGSNITINNSGKISAGCLEHPSWRFGNSHPSRDVLMCCSDRQICSASFHTTALFHPHLLFPTPTILYSITWHCLMFFPYHHSRMCVRVCVF